MILIDYNQVAIQSFFGAVGNFTNIEVEEGALRHVILDSIRKIYATNKLKYGTMVISADSPAKSWRKQLFPYYKYSRKQSRKQSDVHWDQLLEITNKIRNEMKEYLPHPVVVVDHCESDDIIATIVKEEKDREPRILIASSDKDFNQLITIGGNIERWDVRNKTIVPQVNGKVYLKEQILRGDPSDGIPNILSEDDVFLHDEKRQKRITKKKIEKWYTDGLAESFDEDMIKKYNRNRALIDFDRIPQQHVHNILIEYQAAKQKEKKPLEDYFVKFQLKKLYDNIGDFR